MASIADVLLHPVRLRIVLAVAGRSMTTAQIQDELGDVAPATLYRHINRLIESSVLEVTAERPVRGGVERTLALVEGAANLTPEQADELSRDELLDYFVRVMAGLIADFGRYLATPGADPATDGVGFRQIPIWLDDDEFARFASTLTDLVGTAHANTPDGRRRRLLTTVVFPADQAD